MASRCARRTCAACAAVRVTLQLTMIAARQRMQQCAHYSAGKRAQHVTYTSG